MAGTGLGDFGYPNRDALSSLSKLMRIEPSAHSKTTHSIMSKVSSVGWIQTNKTPTGVFKSKILHAEVRTPRELEAEVGLTEGNIFQGELTMDQLLFNRPIPGYAQYRTPLRGLYLCGSSTHPGGGVMGAPGANAASAVLRDLGRSRSP